MHKTAIRGLFFALLLWGGAASAFSTHLRIDNQTGTISWSDDQQSWEYQLKTGDWQCQTLESVYRYDASAQIWIDQSSGERWQYDHAYHAWVQSTGATSSLTHPDTFTSHVWKEDAITHTWQPLIRDVALDGTVSFSPLSSVVWQYDGEHDVWQYKRSGATAYVPAVQEWQVLSGQATWLQTAPSAGQQWQYADGRWQDVATGSVWRMRYRTNTEVVWELSSQSRGALGDSVQWRHKLLTGAWREEELESPSTIMQTFVWRYDDVEHVWHREGAPLHTRLLPPQFAPTPFAQQKSHIDAVVQPILAQGVFWGSPDGTGAGYLDVLNYSFINPVLSANARDLPTLGVFEYNGIPAVTITDTLLLEGDLELHAVTDGVLILGDGTPTGDVTIKPAPAATHAQLIFNPDAGKTIEVQVKNDVSFQALDNLPFYLTFKGKGTTRFRLPSGKAVSFGPENPETGDEGVKIQVLMELEADDIAAGKNQVVFGPWSYESETDNADTDQTTWLRLGPHSFITFVSQNVEGVDEDTHPGYGVMAFDVAHAGPGRTILDVARGRAAGDAIDAGVNVYGNLITGTDGGVVQASDFRSQVSYHKRAGIRAMLRVVDDVALTSIVPDVTSPTSEQAAAWVARTTSSARGLVVLNHCDSYPRLLANLEQAADLENSSWAASQVTNQYQPGFIVGSNGEIEVFHNLFLDYIAGGSTQQISPTFLGGTGKTTAEVKYRNPSALIIDGFGAYAVSADTAWDMDYEAFATTHARITLRGSAGLFLRSGVSAQTGALITAVTEHDDESETLDATIGTGTYDGVFCPVLDSSGVLSTHEVLTYDQNGAVVDSGTNCLDGEHALSVEGELTIRSVLGRFGFAPNGFVNIPSIKLDHTGQEILTQEES